jgi:retron-type reverse transcriptase
VISLHSPKRIAKALADALVEGPWQLDDLVNRGAGVLDRRYRWLRPMAVRILSAFGDAERPKPAHVAAFLREDRGFLSACERHDLSITGRSAHRPVMWPAHGPPSTWDVPALPTVAALAEWLHLDAASLDWFADVQSRNPKAPPGPLRHYDYRWIAKSSGAARLIESPRPRLKALQRRLLDEMLVAIPPHDAAHGFRRGRSVRTCVEPHVGRALVIKMDLRDFFPTITSARITSIFRTAGYPEHVARTLAGLCTSRVPSDVWSAPHCPAGSLEHWRLRRLYREAHLPQGAPTSPALASLCAFRLDGRLTGLTASIGAHYTRYADDLVFSGDDPLLRSARRLHVQVCAIALEEGFTVHSGKTRMMRQGIRQRVAGVVLNERLNVPRADYDSLKATLHNCARLGPGSQNRSAHDDFRAHLAGRIAHVAQLNPNRGERLRAIFDKIAWEPPNIT